MHEHQLALARMLVSTFGPESLRTPETQAPRYLYRAMSEGEFRQAQSDKFLQSDQRADRAAAQEEGYDFPDYGTSAASEVAAGYLPERGAGRVVRIEVHHEDKWAPNPDAWSDGMPEFSTHARVPMTRVSHSPPIVDRRPPAEFYHGPPPELPESSSYGWETLRRVLSDGQFP